MAHTLQGGTERAVSIPPYGLNGDLVVPENATGLVIFAHGSGSSRRSSRNKYVARELNGGGLATLLMDLLTEDEERVDIRTRQLRFDIGMLAERLMNAADWCNSDYAVHQLRTGYFGASTGGGAALVAAARQPERIGAIVSRGGRPDLAGAALSHVTAPTLLINEEAMGALRGQKRMEIVPGATHLFEEPGALEQVADLARRWFQQNLVAGGKQDER